MESWKEELQNFSKLGKVKNKSRRDVKSTLAVKPAILKKQNSISSLKMVGWKIPVLLISEQ